MEINYRAALRRNLSDVRMRTVTSQWRTTIRRSKKVMIIIAKIKRSVLL